MAEIHDITPPHEPIGVAKAMLARAPDATAALAVLVRKDGSLWFDVAGHQRKDILWALVSMTQQIING